MKIHKSALVAFAIIFTSAVGAMAENGTGTENAGKSAAQDTANPANTNVPGSDVKVVSPRAKTPTPSTSEVIDQNAHQSK